MRSLREQELTHQLQICYQPPWLRRDPPPEPVNLSQADAQEALDILYRNLLEYEYNGNPQCKAVVGVMIERIRNDGYETLYLAEGNCVMIIKKELWPQIEARVQELRKQALEAREGQAPTPSPSPSITLEAFGLAPGDIDWFGEDA
jgi:hypothetical protein